MPRLQLFYSPGACSFAPHSLLIEAGLSFDAIEKSIFAGELVEDAYANVNPKRRVPALAIDGKTVTEVPAISTAISHLAPHLQLMGRTSTEQIRVIEWMSWLSCELHAQGFGGMFRPQRFTTDVNMFPNVQERCRKRIHECFDLIENGISDIFAIGELYTAVDPYMFVFYRWGNGSNFDMKRHFPRFSAHADRMLERQSIAHTLRLEGMPLTTSANMPTLAQMADAAAKLL